MIVRKLYTPTRSSKCFCGSGKIYKRCCADQLPGSKGLGRKAQTAIKNSEFEKALKFVRADIVQYTIWHKTNTEPLALRKTAEIQKLLNLDISALGELLDELFYCYRNTDLNAFPAVLERLRVNIKDERWQRKISYYHVMYVLYPDWDREVGKKEFNKLGAMKEEEDVEILQLYSDLYKDELSRSEMEKVCNKIIELTQKASDKLHYRGIKAIQCLLMGESKEAEKIIEKAISEFKNAKNQEKMSSYEKYRLAMSLDLFAIIKNDQEFFNESLSLYKALLKEKGYTKHGRADLYRQIGCIHKNKKEWDLARKAYENAIKITALEIFKVCLSQCFLYLEEKELAIQTISEINVKNLNQEGEYDDYIYALAGIAIVTGQSELLVEARSLLKQLNPSEIYFEKTRSYLLLAVIETQEKGVSKPIIEKTKRMLLKTVKNLSSYLILQPNLFGIGVDVNKVINGVEMAAVEHDQEDYD